MKKLLIGLLVLASFSGFASTPTSENCTIKGITTGTGGVIVLPFTFNKKNTFDAQNVDECILKAKELLSYKEKVYDDAGEWRGNIVIKNAHFTFTQDGFKLEGKITNL